MKRVIAYVRVSRVGGRSGASFISPDEQKKAIERLAAAKGLEIISWLEELDESGGNPLRPKWNEAREIIRRGEAAGIVIYNFARWSRNTEHGLASVRLIREAGGEIWSCQEDFDTRTPNGWAMLTYSFTHAQMQRDQAKENFAISTANAIKRGVWMARRVPFGYLKDKETKRLYPDPVTAPIVVGLFERKAAGDSWSALVLWMAEQGYPKVKNTIVYMLSNPAYLGVSWQGKEVRNETAHEPLVSRELYDRAQAARGVRPARTGALSTTTMLRSLLTCGTCGSTLLVGWQPGKRGEDGKRMQHAVYSCSGKNTGGCAKRAYIRADVIDPYVDMFVLTTMGGDKGPIAEAVARSEEVDRTGQALAEGEHLYKHLLEDTALAAELGPTDVGMMMRAQKGHVEMLRAAHAQARSKADSSAKFEAALAMDWQFLMPEAKRQLLHGIISHINVKSTKGQRGVPVEARVQIVDREGVILNNTPSDFMYRLGHPDLEPHAKMFMGPDPETKPITEAEKEADVERRMQAIHDRLKPFQHDVETAWVALLRERYPDQNISLKR